MGRLCERPGCSEVAAMAYGFDVDRLLVWLAPRDPEGDPMRAGSLCLRHADAMVVPLGWTLDDRRDVTPRLFRTAGAEDPPTAPARAPRAPRRRTARAKDQPSSPPDDPVPDEPLRLDPPPEAPTVAEVTGTSASDDPDATVAIPWIPTFDAGDDLGGVLAARSPLLARAFRGTDRPR